jgi:hypothetical protein
LRARVVLFQKPLTERASMVFFALEKVALSRGATICRLGQIESVFFKKNIPSGSYPQLSTCYPPFFNRVRV